jgi:hypothetical protein
MACKELFESNRKNAYESDSLTQTSQIYSIPRELKVANLRIKRICISFLPSRNVCDVLADFLLLE